MFLKNLIPCREIIWVPFFQRLVWRSDQMSPTSSIISHVRSVINSFTSERVNPLYFINDAGEGHFQWHMWGHRTKWRGVETLLWDTSGWIKLWHRTWWHDMKGSAWPPKIVVEHIGIWRTFQFQAFPGCSLKIEGSWEIMRSLNVVRRHGEMSWDVTNWFKLISDLDSLDVLFLWIIVCVFFSRMVTHSSIKRH